MDLTSAINAINNAVVAEGTDVAQPVVEAVAAGSAIGPVGQGLALGLAVIGAGFGIGKLASSALEGAARQPEAAGQLQGMMILAIAFIEALALLALIFGAFIIK